MFVYCKWLRDNTCELNANNFIVDKTYLTVVSLASSFDTSRSRLLLPQYLGNKYKVEHVNILSECAIQSTNEKA